ncbi:MAG: ATP synthase F1 subunit gamma [Eggerthellaceae bacterium]|nr:ATP synthase F1 subunit gamma [Eggerthellaceae bacterium]
MPNLHDLERRINSVNSTKQITRTMEMVAAAKIRRASERVEEATPYSDSMGEMLANVAANAGSSDNALLTEHDDVKSILYIAVVSDRGLAGGFNSNVLRTVEKAVYAARSEGATAHVVACGKKAISYFEFRKIDLDLVFKDLSADPTLDEALQIATRAIEGYTAGEYDKVVLVYNHAKNAAEQELRTETVLPIDSDVLGKADEAEEESAAEEKELTGDVIYEPDAEAVLDSLLPAYVKTTIYHALVDSAAAEQAARRTAMKSATDNANEMVETLTRFYNRVRQGAITTEINEIVGGAAALEE